MHLAFVVYRSNVSSVPSANPEVNTDVPTLKEYGFPKKKGVRGLAQLPFRLA